MMLSTPFLASAPGFFQGEARFAQIPWGKEVLPNQVAMNLMLRTARQNFISEDTCALGDGQKITPKKGRGKGGQTFQDLEWTPTTTTVMMRNIQNEYTQVKLFEEICARGFAGSFDFFYLPMDFSTKKNKGYAFLNFLKAEIALRFRSEFSNTALPHHSKAHKIVEICVAEVQGFQANVQNYLKQQSRRVVNPLFKPVIFRQLEGGLVGYPLSDKHMPKNVLEEIAGFSYGTQASRIGFKDAPDHVTLSNCPQNTCDVMACKKGEDDVIDDVEVYRSLMEAAVHEICQLSGTYQ